AAESGGNYCAAHPRNLAAGVCQRCGTYLCGVCRTQWLDRVGCLGCLEGAPETGDPRPGGPRAHQSPAVLSLVFGVGAWLLVALAGVPLMLLSGSPSEHFLVLSGLLVFTSFVPALFGVGQGAAAIRARGERMILATCGLVLSGASVGTML